MTCHDCFEAYSCALDGELEPELQASLNDHLESCSDCRHLQTRMLALSGELKSQPFPTVDEASARKLALHALQESATVSWGWLRRLLRFPYETTLPRTLLRLTAGGGLLLLVLSALWEQHLWPLYNGAEAIAKGSAGSGWVPVSAISGGWLGTASLTLLIVGLWTAGLPAFLADLWSGTRLSKADLTGLGLSVVLLAPLVATPLLVPLQLGLYLFCCCLWTAAVAFLIFLLLAVKTQRALPRLAVDFCLLILGLGLIEMGARAALSIQGPELLNTALQRLAGSLSTSDLIAVGLFFGSGALLLNVGAWSAIRSYRSQGGKLAAALLLVAGVGAFTVGHSRVQAALWTTQARVAESELSRRAYLLGSSADNPWILSSVSYPGLTTDRQPETESNQIQRAHLASALLSWDIELQLEVLNQWGQSARGVAWGLAAYVESLGRRQGDSLEVRTESTRKAVASLLQKLQFRRLNDVLLASGGASVSGTLVGYEGRSVRLLPLGSTGSLDEALHQLTLDFEWARKFSAPVLPETPLTAPKIYSAQVDSDGGFRFSHIPAGHYALAVLLDAPRPLTLNSTIPGPLQVKEGQPLDLGTIRLTSGEEGHSLELSATRWRGKGVSFSQNSEIATARIDSGGHLRGFVDTKVFAGGKALVKVRAQGAASAQGVWRARFFSKEGRLIQEWSGELSTDRIHELTVESQSQEGYLQLTFEVGQGPITLREVKVEVLSRG